MESTATPGYEPGPIAQEGCFTGEFGLGDDLPIDHAPYVIARDRIVEARAFNFNRKLLPISVDRETGARYAGGYYLLPTVEEAARMCERWRGSTADLEKRLKALWAAVRKSAREQNLAAIWLLVNADQEESVGLISVASSPPDREALEPDFKGIDRLSAVTSPGEAVSRLPDLSKSLDRTSWIFSIWFPYRDWRTSKKLLWPNSPPFPHL